jgi:hypothetical protein
VEIRVIGRLAVATAATVVLSVVAVSTQAPAQPAGQTPAPGGGGGRGRGRQAGPPEPTPHLADGTVNLGRVPGEKGIWSVPYITNMGARIIGPDGQSLAPPPAGRRGGGAAADGGARGAAAPAAEGRGAARGAGAPLGGGEGGGGGGRGGAKSEPWVPFQPWAAAVYDYNSKNQSKYDPEGYCLPPGGPRLMATPYPAEIIQLPEQKRIIMIFEGATHIWREIFMDGREHPKGDALNPTYLGHSVGHWEGETLVVDVVGFNEATWLDYFGHPHTDMLHVVERFSRPSKGTLHYEALIDDPGAYTKPFTVAWDIPWTANGELSEYICQENNKYLQRLTDDFGKPVFSGK